MLVDLGRLLEAKAHKTPSGVKACVVSVMESGDGKTLSQAFAICQAQKKKSGLRDATEEEVAKFEKILAANRKKEQAHLSAGDELHEVNLGPLQTNVARVCAHAEKIGYKVRRSGEVVHLSNGDKRHSFKVDGQGRFARQGKTLKQVAMDLGLDGGADEGEEGAEGQEGLGNA